MVTSLERDGARWILVELAQLRDDRIGQVAWSRLTSIHPDVAAALLMLRGRSGEEPR